MRKRVVGFTIGALALTGACATATRTERPAPLEAVVASPTPTPRAAPPTIDGASFGTGIVQSAAANDGPRVSIRAEVTQVAAARRVRANFIVDDDAYVLVGHVDAEGVVRIVFPTEPSDDGFVQGGGRAYETAEVFGGFRDQYMFRYSNYGRYHGSEPYAYDGGGGYLFIIAAWRPMHFESLARGDAWDSFEVTSEAYLRDPRPAIYELASVLVDDPRDGYTVRFASYYNTLNSTPFGAYSAYSSFGLSLCSASYFGWGQTIPWTYLSINAPFLTTGFGSSIFEYRGRTYGYDSALGCAVQLPYGYGYRYHQRIAAGPIGRDPTTPVAGRTRMLGIGDSPRDPFEPKPTGARLAPATTARPTAPRSEPRMAQPRSEPRVEQPRASDPRSAEPRSEPRSTAPRSESRSPQPRSEPRAEPRPQPKPEPRSAEPRSAEPRAAPASRPRTPPPDRHR